MGEQTFFGEGASLGEQLRLDQSNPLFANLSPDRQQLFLGFEAERQRMEQEIQALAAQGKEPSAHGTSSNYLESILEQGLGAVTPVGAIARTKSITDAATPDGMLGAYLFAKGLKDHMLHIRREEVDANIDALMRYTRLSPRIPPGPLRMQITRYFQERARAIGPSYDSAYPVLLVVTNDPIARIKPSNIRNVPSERAFDGILGRETIAMVCVPEAYKQDAQGLISQAGLTLKARAIESVELY